MIFRAWGSFPLGERCMAIVVSVLGGVLLGKGSRELLEPCVSHVFHLGNDLRGFRH
jgi:hypothetical protein